MKKAILLVAVAIVAALSLTACNKEDDRPQQPSSFTATEQYNDTIIIRYVSEYASLIEIENNRAYRKWCRETGLEGVLAFMNYHVWAYIEEHPEVLTMFCVDGVIEVEVYEFTSYVAFTFLPQDFPRHYCFDVE